MSFNLLSLVSGLQKGPQTSPQSSCASSSTFASQSLCTTECPALVYYQVCSDDDPGLTMTYFTARSNLVPCAFVWGKGKTMDFSETIVVFDVRVGICS